MVVVLAAAQGIRAAAALSHIKTQSLLHPEVLTRLLWGVGVLVEVAIALKEEAPASPQVTAPHRLAEPVLAVALVAARAVVFLTAEVRAEAPATGAAQLVPPEAAAQEAMLVTAALVAVLALQAFLVPALEEVPLVVLPEETVVVVLAY